MNEKTKPKQSREIIENLVFEGGGTKGIGHTGGIRTMDDLGLLKNVKRVGGASAGSIVAGLLALGYSSTKVAEIVVETDFSKFQDDSFGAVRDTYRLFKNYGWHKGAAFEKWMGKHIAAKFGGATLTFAGLQRQALLVNQPYKDLYVVATNLTKQRIEVYSAETTPNMAIVEAIRISMSIPIFFQCMRNTEGDILVDGGVACNFPIQLFDKRKYLYANSKTPEDYKFNPRTLGFRLDSKEEIKASIGWGSVSKEISNVVDYVTALITFLQEMANKRHLNSCDRRRTVFIETGNVKATDFNLSDEKIKMLYKNGERAMLDYFRAKPLKPLYENYELT
jgi:NTE family protein